MIETLILMILTAVASYIIGYFYGKYNAEELCINYKGWDIIAFENLSKTNYYVSFKKGKKMYMMILDPTKGELDYITRKYAK